MHHTQAHSHQSCCIRQVRIGTVLNISSALSFGSPPLGFDECFDRGMAEGGVVSDGLILVV
jgi:hypothetical protein